MSFFFLDASALVKRYVLENGSEIVNHFFHAAHRQQLLVLTHCIGEVYWAVVRRRNSGLISRRLYQSIVQAMRAELLLSDITLCSVDDSLIIGSLIYIERHSLNSADALILNSALETADEIRAHNHQFIFIASDQRLIRAAQAEGVTTINPEVTSLQEITQLFE